ncbi:hypothetical protein BGZ82_003393, partial [Podila clonocystis]
MKGSAGAVLSHGSSFETDHGASRQSHAKYSERRKAMEQCGSPDRKLGAKVKDHVQHEGLTSEDEDTIVAEAFGDAMMEARRKVRMWVRATPEDRKRIFWSRPPKDGQAYPYWQKARVPPTEEEQQLAALGQIRKSKGSCDTLGQGQGATASVPDKGKTPVGRKVPRSSPYERPRLSVSKQRQPAAMSEQSSGQHHGIIQVMQDNYKITLAELGQVVQEILDTNQAARRQELEVRADQLRVEVRELRSRVQWQHLMAAWTMQTVPGTGSNQS